MITFIYRAKDDKGKIFSGVLEADNKKILREKLRNAGYYLVATRQAKDEGKSSLFKEHIKTDVLIMFTQQLTSMLEAGLPILKSLEIMWQEINHSKMQIVISQIRNRLNNGGSISEAIKEFPNVFPSIYAILLTVAETGAGLIPILKKLLEYLNRQKEFMQKVRKATVYPVIVVAFSIIVVILLLTFVVPTFQKVFQKIKVELPLLTQIIIKVSAATRTFSFWIITAVAAAGIIFLYKKISSHPYGQLQIDRLKLRMPLFGKIFYISSLNRFVHSFSLLLAAGVSVSKSIEAAKDTVINKEIENSLEETQKKIIAGMYLSDALREAGTFPSVLVEMVSVGEQSGRLGELLGKVAGYFEEEMNVYMNKLLTALEPMLIFFVGAIVMFVLLSVYLPIFKLWQDLPG